MLNVGVFCFFASYMVAFCLELSRLKLRSRVGRGAMLLAAAAGLFAHTVYLLVRSQKVALPPLLSSAHDWLLVLAWLVIVVYLILSIADERLALGAILLPVGIALVAASPFVSLSADRLPSVYRGWIMLHVSTLVLGTSATVLGFLFSLAFFWQHYRLKHGQAMQGGLKLPSLERLAQCNLLALVTATPLLSFGMLSGIGLVMFGAGQTSRSTWTDPLVLGGIAGWLGLCGVLVWTLSRRDQPDKKVARLTLWATGLLVFTVVGGQIITAALKSHTLHGNAPPTQVLRYAETVPREGAQP